MAPRFHQAVIKAFKKKQELEQEVALSSEKYSSETEGEDPAPSFIKKALTKVQNIPDKRGKVAIAMKATSHIATGLGKLGVCPLAGMVGCALSAGATILEYSGQSELDKVQENLMRTLKEMQVENAKYDSEIARIQDVVNLSFLIAVDLKYKDGIQRVDAAFEAYQFQTDLEVFTGFAFELQTCAHQYFKRNNIKEYLGLIFAFKGEKEASQGKEACQTITHYIIIVLSKYLRMMAAFHVYKMDEIALAADYEFFNSSYDNILAVYREVTGERFVAGNLPPLESVKNSLKNTGVTEVDSEPPKVESSTAEVDKEVSEFLRKLDLADLIPSFAEEGIAMTDIADLTNSDLKNLGVDQFRQRKVLLRAGEDLTKQQGAAAVESMESGQETKMEMKEEGFRAYLGRRGSKKVAKVKEYLEEMKENLDEKTVKEYVKKKIF